MCAGSNPAGGTRSKGLVTPIMRRLSVPGAEIGCKHFGAGARFLILLFPRFSRWGRRSLSPRIGEALPWRFKIANGSRAPPPHPSRRCDPANHPFPLSNEPF
ncbi:hypothetical protein Sm713_16270 [Streptomyces sp. TS71-3]|nr:hypothetical protein Sm713_16270 [Streptomyces sp. TS71-3]